MDKNVLEYFNKYLIRRIDDGIIPYLSNKDFKSLNKNEFHFTNSKNEKIAYFSYFYDNYIENKVILFLHGIGPGHIAYIREIELICSFGYKVITLDYTGCGFSTGESLKSMFTPTKDVLELLDLLKIKEEIIVVGHSLGGFTTLNIMNILPYLNRGIVLSGFPDITKVLNKKIDPKPVYDYELINNPLGYIPNNMEYLKNTNDEILFIHSKDDHLVEYDKSVGYILDNIDNSNLEFYFNDLRGHNPNYTIDSVNYMNKTFMDYTMLIKKGNLDTVEKKKDFMKDKSAMLMTNQDEIVKDKIKEFLNRK